MFSYDSNKLQWPLQIFYGLDYPINCFVSPQYFDTWNEKFGLAERCNYLFVVNGVEYEQDGVVYILSEDGTATVSGHTANLPNQLVIPEAITKNGVSYTVTYLSKRVFNECTNLTSVNLLKSTFLPCILINGKRNIHFCG